MIEKLIALTKKEKARSYACLLIGLAAVLLAVLWTAGQTGASFLKHSPFDSYTLQALAWREGSTALDFDRPWLELAIFEGKYFVSFPPVPSVPMWLLSFVFGENTPSGLVTLLYFLGGYIAAFFLARRHLSPGQSALCAVFVALGGSLLDLAVSDAATCGGVWYQAQTLAFLLTMLAFLLLDGDRPTGWAAGLIAIALAVGCRPFNALYVPLLLYMLFEKLRRDTLWDSVRRMVPYLIVPALIACVYGAYNFARFGTPLEFGHSYLPEFTNSGEPMFSLAYLPLNLSLIFRAPWVERGKLAFSTVSAFAVYLTNPLLLFGLLRGLWQAARRRAGAVDLLAMGTIALHALFLLTHRTNGGWQYGTRYLCDTLPALLFLCVRGKKSVRLPEAVSMGGLIAFNLYATVVFHFL